MFEAEMTRSYPTTKALGIFLLGLIFGVGGETILFMRNQCRLIESTMLDDFRVLAFLSKDVPDSKGKVIEEKVRAVNGVADARFLSRDEALKVLQGQDPELVKSVAVLGENPLGPFIEIRPAPDQLATVPAWSQALSRIPEIAETRYKAIEWNATLRAQLYGRFLDLIARLAMLCWCLAAALSLWVVLRHGEHKQLTEFLHERLIWGCSGVVAGVGLVFVCARPFEALGAPWPWPSAALQGFLAFVGTFGVALLPEWQETATKRRGHPPHAGDGRGEDAPFGEEGDASASPKTPAMVIVLVAAAFAATSAWSESAGVKRKELREVQKQLEQKRREIADYERQTDEMKRDLSKLAGQTSESKRKIRALEGRIREAESRKAQTKNRLWALESTEGQWRQVLDREVNDYFRSGVERSDLVGRQALWAEAFRRAAILEKSAYVRQLKGTRVETQALAADVAKTGKELQAKSQRARSEHETKQLLYQHKRESFEETKGKVTDLQVAIHDLQDSAVALSKLLRSLEKRSPYKPKDGSILPAQSPHSLPWPVDGRVVSTFGRQQAPELGTWYINQGIRFSTASEAVVKPIKRGKVIFAGPFRSYGQVMIVDHGGDFYSIYGNLGDMRRKKGESVRPSDALGIVGRAKEGGQLYFEIRQSGDALDPVVWLKK